MSVGAEAVVNPNSVLMPGSSVGEGAELAPLSCLPSGQAQPAGSYWEGAPAKPCLRRHSRLKAAPGPMAAALHALGPPQPPHAPPP